MPSLDQKCQSVFISSWIADFFIINLVTLSLSSLCTKIQMHIFVIKQKKETQVSREKNKLVKLFELTSFQVEKITQVHGPSMHVDSSPDLPR